MTLEFTAILVIPVEIRWMAVAIGLRIQLMDSRSIDDRVCRKKWINAFRMRSLKCEIIGAIIYALQVKFIINLRIIILRIIIENINSSRDELLKN